MTVALCIVLAGLAWFLCSVVVCVFAPREPSGHAGMPAVAREAGQAVLRRALGARPKAPRHAGGGR